MVSIHETLRNIAEWTRTLIKSGAMFVLLSTAGDTTALRKMFTSFPVGLRMHIVDAIKGLKQSLNIFVLGSTILTLTP